MTELTLVRSRGRCIGLRRFGFHLHGVERVGLTSQAKQTVCRVSFAKLSKSDASQTCGISGIPVVKHGLNFLRNCRRGHFLFDADSDAIRQNLRLGIGVTGRFEGDQRLIQLAFGKQVQSLTNDSVNCSLAIGVICNGAELASLALPDPL